MGRVSFFVMASCLLLSSDVHAAKGERGSKTTCGDGSAQVGGAPPALFRIGGSNFEFQGLTAEGKKIIGQARANLLEADALGRQSFFEMDSFMTVMRIAQMGRFNIAALGEGGGAKTGFFDFMIPDLWIKQVHEMMNEVPLVGGQTEAGARDGREDINFKGTILDNVAYAMLDEGQNANPAVLLVLQSLLNERMVTVNGKKIPADALRTIIYTGNADRPGIIKHFADRGTPFSGAPFLNRFQFKFRVHNWLRTENQAKLDAVVARKKYLQAISTSHPDALKDALLQKPKDIDFDALERFAHATFTTTPEFDVVVRALAEEMKLVTEKAIRESQRDHLDDPKKTPNILTPSADYTTRLRTQIANIIKMSAALDFLRSPLAAPDKIDRYTKQQIKLGPMSSWRAWSVLTTVGKDRVIFDPHKKEIHFGATFDPMGRLVPQNLGKEIEDAKKVEVANELRELGEEQDRFKAAFTNSLKVLGNAAEEAARVTGRKGGKGDDEFDIQDFEIELANAGGTDVQKVTLPKPK